MGRPQSNAPEVRSRMAFVRLREVEWVGLKQLAADLDQASSRIIRRLIPRSAHRRSGLLR